MDMGGFEHLIWSNFEIWNCPKDPRIQWSGIRISFLWEATRFSLMDRFRVDLGRTWGFCVEPARSVLNRRISSARLTSPDSFEIHNSFELAWGPLHLTRYIACLELPTWISCWDHSWLLMLCMANCPCLMRWTCTVHQDCNIPFSQYQIAKLKGCVRSLWYRKELG